MTAKGPANRSPGYLIAARHARAQGGGPISRQLAEALLLKLLRSQTIRYYYTSRLWRRQLSWRDKCDHLNYREYDLIRTVLNGRELSRHFNNKLRQKEALLAAGIATPALLGFFHATEGWCHPSRGALRDRHQLRAFLQGQAGRTLAFKLVDGACGRAFQALRVDLSAAGVVLSHPVTGADVALDELFHSMSGQPSGFLVEEYFEQHPEMAELHPSSVNTLRVWAWRTALGTRVVLAYLRIGRAHSLVDNRHAGGLYSTLDLATGRILELRTGGLIDRTLDEHPDTGRRIAGRLIPHWQPAQDLACRAIEALPGCHIAGVDVAIGKHGPAILELNVANPDQVDFGITDTPGRRVFREVIG